MRRSIVTLTLLLLTTALLACQTDAGAARDDTGSEAATESEPASDDVETTPAEEQAPLALTDNEIAGVAASIHEGEISHARIARERATSPKVRSFAEQMITDHTRALNELDALRSTARVVPETSTLQQRLTSEALNLEQTLAAADPAEVDRLYMSAQVTLHERALQIADRELLPAAKSAELGAYLRRLRPVLERHLEMARAIDREQSIALR